MEDFSIADCSNILTFVSGGPQRRAFTLLCRSEAKKLRDLGLAAEAMEESASKKKTTRTTKRAPYRSSSRWSRLLKVSTLQRSVQIWGFAVLFAIKYLLSTRKFTYGKKVGVEPVFDNDQPWKSHPELPIMH